MPRPRLLLGGALLLCLAAYAPMFPGMFLFDDLPAIVENPALHPPAWDLRALFEAAFSHRSGPLYRPLSMLSFALQEALGLGSPAAYRLVNLAIHLLNGLLLYLLTIRVLGHLRGAARETGPVAALVAGVWLLHPLHVSVVAYPVQRMALLAATFVLAGLLAYCAVRRRQIEGRAPFLLLPAAFLPWLVPAVLSKENGALLPLFALVLELFVFRFAMPGPAGVRGLRRFHLLVVGLPALAGALLFLAPERVASGYALRDFDLVQRLLTQARVLWLYLSWLAWPDVTRMGLYHDDITLSRGLLEPPTTLAALLALTALVVLAWRLRRRHPLPALGIAFFLAGHLLESTILPLEMAYEHRNYLPSWGLFLALAGTAAFRPGGRWRVPAALLLCALLALATGLRAAQWSDLGRFHRAEAANHPRSMRAQMGLGEYCLKLARRGRVEPARRRQLLECARRRLERAATVHAGGTRPLALLLLGADAGHWLARPGWREALGRRLLAGDLTTDKDQALVLLVRCRVRQGCRELDRWLGGTLEQMAGAASAVTRPRLLYLAATLLAEGRGELRRAIGLLREALRLRPEQPLFRLALAHLLVETGALSEAARELERLEGGLTGRRERRRLRELRERLRKAEGAGRFGKNSPVSRADGLQYSSG